MTNVGQTLIHASKIMSSTVEFSYQTPSQIRHTPTFNELVLSHHTDIEELTHVPCFFHGGIIDPFLTAKCTLYYSIEATILQRKDLVCVEFMTAVFIQKGKGSVKPFHLFRIRILPGRKV